MLKQKNDIGEMYREAVTDFATPSGIPVKGVYTPEDISGVDFGRDIGLPGKYPFTRGHHPEMYRGRLWNIKQITGPATPVEYNKRTKFEACEGEASFDYHVDAVTNHGIEPDQPSARSQIGVTGVITNRLDDVMVAIEGLPLDKVSMSLSCHFPTLTQAYILAAKKYGYSQQDLRIAHPVWSMWIAICAPTYRELFFIKDRISTLGRWVYDFCEYALRNLPRLKLWYMDGASICDAGANVIQEIACIITSRNELIREMLRRGVDVNTVGSAISPTFALDRDFFENIAKVRALRRMWARTMKELGVTDPAALALRMHANVIGSTLARQQPLVNIARGAIQGLSGVLAGCMGMHISCYDEPYSIPTEEAVRMSVRIQQVLRYESGVARVADPLAGSYYVEWLTTEIEKRAEELVNKIEGMGGFLAVLQSGWLQKEIMNEGLNKEEKVESGERTVVGVNRFTIPPEEDFEPEIYTPDSGEIKAYLARLSEFRKKRDTRKVKESLENLRRIAGKTNDNLTPYVFAAIEADATFPEIIGVLRMVDRLEYDWAGEREYPFK